MNLSGGYAVRPDHPSEGSLTTPLRKPLVRTNAQSQTKVQIAAYAFENALEGLVTDKIPHPRDVMRLRRMRHDVARWRSVYENVCIVLGMMTLMETPLWCDNSNHLFDMVNATVRCPLPGGADPQMSGLPIIPPGVSMIVEVICMALIFIVLKKEKDMHAAVESAGGGQGTRRSGLQPEVLLPLLEVMFLDLLLFAALRWKYRIAPIGRLILLFYWPRVVTIFSSAWLCLKEFTNLVIMMLLAVVTFAWLVTMILDDIKDKRTSDAKEIAGDGMATFSATLRSFFTLMTGSGFPDVGIKLIQNQRWTVLIFFPFMLLVWFLLTQLLLAVVCQTYQDNQEDGLKSFYQARARGVADAFRALQSKGRSGEPVVTAETFKSFLEELDKNPTLEKTLEPRNAHLLFTALDDDGSGELSLNEFFDVSDMVLCEFSMTPKYSVFKRKYGWHLTWATTFVESGRLDDCINMLLIVNGVFIVAESYMDINDYDEPHFLEIGEQLFSMVYVVEVIMKLLVISWPTYWSSGANQFDFCVTWLLFVAGFLDFMPGNPWVTPFVRYFNLIRIARLIRLLGRVERFKKMMANITKLLRVSGDLAMLLIITDAFFAIIGMQLFGGLLYKDHPDLQDLAYINNGYYVLNFNGMTESMETMVSFTINNYQMEFAEAMDKATGIKFIGVIYCGVFFFVAVGISFNIFTAFTINIFMALRDLDKGSDGGGDAEGEGEDADDGTPEEEKNLKPLRDKCAKEDLCLQVNKPPQAQMSDIQAGIFEGLKDTIDKERSATRDETMKALQVAGPPPPGQSSSRAAFQSTPVGQMQAQQLSYATRCAPLPGRTLPSGSIGAPQGPAPVPGLDRQPFYSASRYP